MDDMSWVNELKLFTKLINDNSQILASVGGDNTPFDQKYDSDTDISLPSFLWQACRMIASNTVVLSLSAAMTEENELEDEELNKSITDIVKYIF